MVFALPPISEAYKMFLVLITVYPNAYHWLAFTIPGQITILIANIYLVPSMVVIVLPMLIHLIFRIILWGQ